MQFANLKEVIDFAVEKEQEARKFYEDASREASMSGVKEMLLEFAEEEKKHEQMLKEFGEGRVIEHVENYTFKWIKDIKRSNYMVEMDFKPGMGFKEILSIAMKREEKALALYNELQENADNEKMKNLFKILCQEEARHKQVLETQYDDFMAKMGD